jgi:hypothetical protein
MLLISHAMGLASSGSRVRATIRAAVRASVTVTGTAVRASVTGGTAIGGTVLHSRHAVGAAVRRTFAVFGSGRGVTVVVHTHPNLQV